MVNQHAFLSDRSLDRSRLGASFDFHATSRDGINDASMPLSLTTEVRMIKGVGPQRAELLAKRGIYTLNDLLLYLPFRYEDRMHFSHIKDIKPDGIYTIRARVMNGQALRTMRGRDAIYNLLVQDPPGQ